MGSLSSIKACLGSWSAGISCRCFVLFSSLCWFLQWATTSTFELHVYEVILSFPYLEGAEWKETKKSAGLTEDCQSKSPSWAWSKMYISDWQHVSSRAVLHYFPVIGCPNYGRLLFSLAFPSHPPRLHNETRWKLTAPQSQLCWPLQCQSAQVVCPGIKSSGRENRDLHLKRLFAV